MSYQKKYRVYGFTLIEVLIVVTIVGVLAAIVVPSYQDSLRSARRGDAKAELSRLAQGEHKYRISNAAYANSTALATALDSSATALVSSSYYDFAVTSNTGSVFTITAAPRSSGGQSLDTCATLTFNQDAVISSSDSTACPHP